jgi:hypothetical protein
MAHRMERYDGGNNCQGFAQSTVLISGPSVSRAQQGHRDCSNSRKTESHSDLSQSNPLKLCESQAASKGQR